MPLPAVLVVSSAVSGGLGISVMRTWKPLMLKALGAFKKLARTISTPPKMAVELQFLTNSKDIDECQEERQEDDVEHDSALNNSVLYKPEEATAETPRQHVTKKLGSGTPQGELQQAIPAAEPKVALAPESDVAGSRLAISEDLDALAQAGGDGDEPEFELWVETELEAAWCLEDPSAPATDEQWRGACQTSMVRRRWDEFEALPGAPTGGARRRSCPSASSSSSTLDSETSPSGLPRTNESLRVLGLVEGADEAEVRAAFRKCSLACHPDKGGSADDFQNVIKAYQSLAQPK